MKKISVIVPIYKAEKYLDRCITSIVNQTYKNLEIILVDDGSPDNSSEICDQWAERDGRIVVIHQKNSGVSVARNVGLQRATGAYLLMVDSDDYVSLDMIEILHHELIEKDAQMAVCAFREGSEEQYSFMHTKDGQGTEVIKHETALKRSYENNVKALQYIAPWGKLYKKELFKDILYPEGKIFEDIYVTHQLIYRCDKIVVIDFELVYYYQHTDSIMNREFHVGKLDYLQALEERMIFFKEKHLKELEQIAYDEYLHSLIWEYSRSRDILRNESAMKDIQTRFREAYKKGYGSMRYLEESKLFLMVFNMNPEFIIWYWKIKGKFQSILHRGKK